MKVLSCGRKFSKRQLSLRHRKTCSDSNGASNIVVGGAINVHQAPEFIDVIIRRLRASAQSIRLSDHIWYRFTDQLRICDQPVTRATIPPALVLWMRSPDDFGRSAQNACRERRKCFRQCLGVSPGQLNRLIDKVHCRVAPDHVWAYILLLPVVWLEILLCPP